MRSKVALVLRVSLISGGSKFLSDVVTSVWISVKILPFMVSNIAVKANVSLPVSYFHEKRNVEKSATGIMMLPFSALIFHFIVKFH